MAALTAPRVTQQIGGTEGGVLVNRFQVPIEDDTIIFQGSLVQVNTSGNAVPAGSQTDTHLYTTVGRAYETYDNTQPGHAAGALTVEPQEGAFLWDIGADADALVQADFGATVYAIDDHTVGKTSATSTRAKAGIFLGIDPATGQAMVQTALT